MWAVKAACFRAFQKVMQFCMLFLDWSEPQLLTGPGAVLRLPGLIREKGYNKVMVVTDKGLMKLHILDGLFRELNEAGIRYILYDGVQPNPSIENIEEARARYVANDCQAMIAFGGGSPMDCAKAACARVVKPKQTIRQMRGQLKVLHRLPPFFAVPTTAGTGSEATLAAVVSDAETHEKYAINDPSLRPRFAVLDPELTVGLPPNITAATGMDALTHAVEAYIGRSNNRTTRDYAERATALIFKNLETVYKDGKNIEARSNMLFAAFYAGMAFTRAYVGYVHAVAHNLGGLYGIPHGLANAVILPVMLEEYGDRIYPQLARLAVFAGIAVGSEEQRAQKFISEIYAMNERMGIPHGFAQIREEDIPLLVSRALREANPLYPVPVIFDAKRLTGVVQRLRIK